MADPFQPKFVDLVRNYTTTTGTGNIVLGQPVVGHDGLAQAIAVGERFFYCITGVDKPAEREVGRGTMQSNGTIAREPIGGGLTNFTTGSKTIALVVGAEWFAKVGGWINGGADSLAALTTTNKTSLVGAVNEIAASGGGGSVASLTFTSCSGAALPTSIKRVDTCGYSAVGVGAACYVYDASVNSAFVTANARTAFLAADGRGFRLDAAQRLTIEMFGGLPGGTMAANGAGNLAAMQAAAQFLPDATRGFSPTVHFGVGTYYCSTTLNPTQSFHFKGEGHHFNGGRPGYNATRIVWPVDTACVSLMVAGSTVEGISIEQASQGATLNSAHGIVARYKPVIRDCAFVNIAGHCIEIGATAGSGGATEGNCNEWRVQDCFAHSSNGDGLYVWGADANGGYNIGFTTAFGVGGCGIRDSAYYTNSHIAPQITGYGAGGVTFGGRHYQLLSSPAQGATTTPGTNENVWYDLGTGAVTAKFPAYVAGTSYQLGLPILATGQGATIIGPYVEFGATVSHAPSAMGTRGNAVFTRATSLPDVDSATHAMVTQSGVGFAYSSGGNLSDPTIAANGDYSRVQLGTVDPDAGSFGRRNIMEVAVGQDGSAPMLWRWQGKDQRLGYYNQRTIWSISGPATARTFGRSTPQPYYLALHDYALIDPTDSSNALIHGLRSSRPTSGSHALGEFVWSTNPAAGVLGWSCVSAGTPGSWIPVPAAGGIVADRTASATAGLTDANGYLRFANAAAVTFTIPPNASVPFPIGTVIELEQSGAGALSIAAGAGVTVNSRGGDLTLAGQFAVAAVKQVALNLWTLTGDL